MTLHFNQPVKTPDHFQTPLSLSSAGLTPAASPKCFKPHRLWIIEKQQRCTWNQHSHILWFALSSPSLPPLALPLICYFGNDLYSCGIRVGEGLCPLMQRVRHAEWHYTGLLCFLFLFSHCFTGRWFSSLFSFKIYTLISFLTYWRLLQKLPYVYWTYCNYQRLGYSMFALHPAAYWTFKGSYGCSETSTQLVDCMNYALKIMYLWSPPPLSFSHLQYCMKSWMVCKFYAKWLPLVSRIGATSGNTFSSGEWSSSTCSYFFYKIGGW